jgi:alpha-tubulin suppressor-like RCC1 family protein
MRWILALLLSAACVPALADSRIVKLVGEGAVYALHADGRVVGWGACKSGQMGPDAPCAADGRTRGAVVIALPGRAIDVASSGGNGYALLDDGRLFAWGAGLGLGLGGGASGVVVAGGQQVDQARDVASTLQSGAGQVQRAADGDAGAALSLLSGLLTRRAAAAAPPSDTASTPAAAAQPGPDSAVPVQVPLAGVKQLSGCSGVVIALMSDGSLRAWGGRGSGRIGDGKAVKRFMESSPPALSPVTVPGVSNIVAVSVGPQHVLALVADGTVLAWGSNYHGALGRLPREELPLDTAAAVPGLRDVVQVAAGNGLSTVVKRDGSVWAWGANWHGQFGDGTQSDPAGVDSGWDIRPRPVPGIGDVVLVTLGTGGRHTLALLKDGSLRGWGNTDWGQLGNGISGQYLLSPMRPQIQQVALVLASNNNSFAVRTDGTVWAWGSGDTDGWPFARNTRVPVAIALP